MKEYMIISDTLKQSDYWYKYTCNALHPFITKVTRTPIRTIEADRMRLYFTNANTWNAKYKYGRRMEVMWDHKLEMMLKEIKANKMCVLKK